jgi:hypothetical protein
MVEMEGASHCKKAILGTERMKMAVHVPVRYCAPEDAAGGRRKGRREKAEGGNESRRRRQWFDAQPVASPVAGLFKAS